MVNVGFVIKQARMQKGLTQEQLAEKVGVKKSAVAKWENGRVSEIKRSNLKMLAEALDLNPNQLLGNDEEKPTAQDDGLSEAKRKLIEKIKKFPEDQVLLLLQVAERIE